MARLDQDAAPGARGSPRGPDRRRRLRPIPGPDRRRGPRRLSDLPGASPHLGRWLATTAALALGAAAGLWGTSLWSRATPGPVPASLATPLPPPREPATAPAERRHLDALAARIEELSPTDLLLTEQAWETCAFTSAELADLARLGTTPAIRARARDLAVRADALLGAGAPRPEPKKSTQ